MGAKKMVVFVRKRPFGSGGKGYWFGVGAEFQSAMRLHATSRSD